MSTTPQPTFGQAIGTQIDTAMASEKAIHDKALADLKTAGAKEVADLKAANVANFEALSKTWAAKEAGYLKTIEELRNPKPTDPPVTPPPPVIAHKTIFGSGGGNVKRKGPNKVDRRYYGAADSEIPKALADIKANALLGIVTWVSFKVPVSWADAAAGKANAWFAKICKALADGIAADDDIDYVLLSIHHEPEGDADEDDWRMMQDTLSRQVPGGIKGALKYVLTTTGWNQEFNKNAEASEVDWETNLYPWGAPIWGIAYDAPYQTYGQVYDSKGVKTTFNNAWTDPNVYVDALADRAAAISAKEKRTGEDALKALIGEMGFGDEAFAKEPTWLDKVFARAIFRKLWAVCYFDTKLNSSHTWWLGEVGSKKRAYFDALIKKLNA